MAGLLLKKRRKEKFRKIAILEKPWPAVRASPSSRLLPVESKSRMSCGCGPSPPAIVRAHHVPRNDRNGQVLWRSSVVEPKFMNIVCMYIMVLAINQLSPSSPVT